MSVVIVDNEKMGSFLGEVLRRAVHTSFAWIPLGYFSLMAVSSDDFKLCIHLSLLFLFVSCLILDCLRIKHQWIIFGARHYESQRLSSMTFMLFGVLVVLFLSPNHCIATAIIVSASIVDPIMGVMRRCSLSPVMVFISGVSLVFATWMVLGSHAYFSLSWVFVISVITVWVEYYQWRLIDDNLLLQIVPLSLVLYLAH
ncbi:MAG: hypothetical protein CL816_00960 [Coxiellaceae bacterium]|nr:hypothetical protein [Coxiellaceae bacterium]|tara:strand:- start:2847 stop:3443 length:597 start_codon:yes stop_codon:yes gene_type:complete